MRRTLFHRQHTDGAVVVCVRVCVCWLQSVNVKPEVVASIAGARLLAVSPVVMVDPRRRKFHRPVTVSVPLSRLPTSYPAAAASDLRLLCSLAGACFVIIGLATCVRIKLAVWRGGSVIRRINKGALTPARLRPNATRSVFP